MLRYVITIVILESSVTARDTMPTHMTSYPRDLFFLIKYPFSNTLALVLGYFMYSLKIHLLQRLTVPIYQYSTGPIFSSYLLYHHCCRYAA